MARRSLLRFGQIGFSGAVMTRHRRLWLIGLVGVPLLAWGFDRVAWMDWVGSTDVEVEFIVTEATTGQSIENAKIVITSEDRDYREGEEKQFQLETNPEGKAQQMCHCLCSGNISGLCITQSRVINLPWWYFQASASGYRPSERACLHGPEYAKQIQRIGRRADKLIVRLSLQKADATLGTAFGGGAVVR
jgi:hypothetical protein